MSIKRRATNDLNHENWDQEEKDEKEMGSYKIASDEVLEKRVIKTAKRRVQNTGDEDKKPVFSGFGGFNKTQPSSYDFLSNLTNGNKPDLSAASTSNTTTTSNVSSNIFSNVSSNKVSTSVASTTTTKPTTEKLATESTSLFRTPMASPTVSIFASPKTDSVTPNNNPFKSPVASSTINNSKPAEASNAPSSNNVSFVASNSTGTQPQQISISSVQTTENVKIADSEINNDSNSDNEPEIKNSKFLYYGKLKGLNISVSEWLQKHVAENPLCLLTPIFDSYAMHLKKINEELEIDEKEEAKANGTLSKKINEETLPQNLATSGNDLKASQSVNATPLSTPKSIFGAQTTQSSNLSFGYTSTPGTNTTSSGFIFGVSSTQSTSTTTSPFVTSNSTSDTQKAAFSFGNNKPFSFNSNIQVQKPTTDVVNENNEEEDEPPKVEFTPIVEENSVFDKRCKIFIKKDGNFVDKGIGTLYIKKIQDSGKYQLLVRANTNLGNVLLNLVLSSSIPTQLMGKNNVMMVCIPNPEAKPPPVPILIRVKTTEEAEELLNTLNKYKA